MIITHLSAGPSSSGITVPSGVLNFRGDFETLPWFAGHHEGQVKSTPMAESGDGGEHSQ